MMKQFLALSLSFGLAACGSKSHGSAACGDAIGKGVDQMFANNRKRVEARATGADPDQLKNMLAGMDEMAGKLKAALVTRCSEDAWSDEVIKCFAAAASREDMRGCQAKLPQDAQDKVAADVKATMGGRGMGRGGRHGRVDRAGSDGSGSDLAGSGSGSGSGNVAGSGIIHPNMTPENGMKMPDVDEVGSLTAQLVTLDAAVSAAKNAVAKAQDDSARDAANAKLDDLKKQQDDLKAKLAAAKARKGS